MATVRSDQEVKILESTGVLFERYGYRKTTIEDIAKESKIGKGSVYLHFESKEALGLSWLGYLHDDLYGQLEAITLEDSPLTDRIQTYLMHRVMFRFDLWNRHQRSMDDALMNLRQLVCTKREAFHQREATLLQSLVDEGIGASRFEVEDPERSSLAMIQATNSLLPYGLSPQELGDRNSVEDRALAIVNLLIRSLHPIKTL